MTRVPAQGSRDADDPRAPRPGGVRWLRAAWILVILTATSACDNVEWGGITMELRPPPATDTADADGTEQEVGPTLPEGPVLFVVRRPPAPAEGAPRPSTATLVPVAEIGGDSLRSFSFQDDGFRALFVRELMAEGREFALFAGGNRVGTFVTGDEHLSDDSFCAPRPAARGVVELTPDAVGVQTFLALPRDEADGLPRGPYRTLESDPTQRNATVTIAGELIPQVGAQWPTSLPVARRDLQILPMESGALAVAATFLFRDQMAVGEPSDGTWALFILAEPDGEDYGSSFVWYREARRDGKGIPRVVGHLDWDRDGRTELLLEVLGARSRWFAALDRPGAEWERVYQDPCGTAGRQAPSPPPGG